MNNYQTNYRAVISVTEGGNSCFSIDLSKDRDRAKAHAIEKLGLLAKDDALEGVLEFSQGLKKSTDFRSHSSEYELMMDVYWKLAKSLITETQGNNIIHSFNFEAKEGLTNDNFKVILINIDFVK